MEISNLDNSQLIQVQANILGYKRLPPTIREFVTDDYYLGKKFKNGGLYPFWLEVLEKIYPTCIHTAYPFVIFTGAIGGGKSTVTKIMALYTLCRLGCLDNYDYFGIVLTKTLDFIFSHVSSAKAWNDQIASCYSLYDISPYFTSEFVWSNELYNFVTDGPRVNNSIGGDAIFYHFSEVNFINYWTAKYKIDQAFDRYKSRFLRVKDYFGGIVIDSSAAGDESIVDYLIQNYPENLLVVREPIWVIKKHLGTYGKLGWFKVYTGDSLNPPFIIDETHPLTESHDPDKVIEVPKELYPNYCSDIVLSLQNTAGISTTSTDKYFTNIDALRDSFSIHQHIPDVIEADFYSETDNYFEQIINQLRLEVPRDHPIFIGIDMGISGDLAGFAISHFVDWVYKGGKKTNKFITRCPLAVGISRIPGQETAIHKIFDLIKSIDEEGYEIGAVVTDQYQSTQLRQDLNREGIYAYLSSVDRTYEPYNFLKHQIYRGHHTSVNNRLLIEEKSNLIDTGYKVDHKSEYSKDISDAECNSVYAISQNITTAESISVKYSNDMQLKAFKKMKENDILTIVNKNRYEF